MDDRVRRAGVRRSFDVGPSRDHRTILVAIVGAARAHGRTPRAIAVIEVVPGPGRFRAVRETVVTVNALAWALGVPLVVRGRRVRAVVPEYGAEPHIG